MGIANVLSRLNPTRPPTAPPPPPADPVLWLARCPDCTAWTDCPVAVEQPRPGDELYCRDYTPQHGGSR